MNLLLVTFALRDRFRDYDSFFVALRGNAIQWCHYIEHTYVVVTERSATELASRLSQHINATDSILIVPVTPPIDGWLPFEAWQWLTDQMNARSASTRKLIPAFIPPPPKPK